MATNNKIQVIYRLEDLVVLCWPVRPNDSETLNPESYNLYWSDSTGGAFLIVDSVDNKSHSSRSFLNKVVLNLIPSKVAGWDNSIVNYVKLKAVISSVEQAFENPILISPYSIGGMRITKESTDKTVSVGYNSDEDRLIPVAVDVDGKVKTI